MSKYIIIAVLIIGFTVIPVLAQDPGNPDSIIIALVEVQPGVPSVMIPVYAVTDNPVAEIVLPLEWSGLDNEIHPSGVYYYNPLISWDLMSYTIDMDNNHLVIWGDNDTGGETNPVLNTDGQRQIVMVIRMVIHPNAAEQYVPLCPYVDEIRGPAKFTLEDGATNYMPAIVCGGLRYGSVDIPEIQSLPDKFRLEQNYPNPFNLNTEINFTVASDGFVTLEIYDILGKKVKTLISDRLNPGYFSARWDGVDETGQVVSSGLYFYTLESEGIKLSKKMLLLK